MAPTSRTLPVLAAVVGLLTVAVSAATRLPGNCNHTSYDAANGKLILFQNLDKIKPQFDTQDFEVEDAYQRLYRYAFRVCEYTTTCVTDTAGTAACQTFNTDTETQVVSLGTYDSMKIVDYPTSEKSRGVMFIYSDGSDCPTEPGTKRKVYITAECEPNGAIPVSAIYASNHLSGDRCESEIYISSPWACPTTADGVCDGITDCTSCQKQAGCGWCSSFQRCSAGDATGPNSGICETRAWHFDSSNPCVDCPSITSCSQCSLQPDCKYCEEGGCQGLNSINCLGVITCSCPPCTSGQYCPDFGGQCESLPSVAGLFIGGMLLGLGLAAIFGGIYYWWKTRQASYTGLA